MKRIIMIIISVLFLFGCGIRAQTPFGELNLRDRESIAKIDPFLASVEKSNYRDGVPCEKERFNGRAKAVIGKITKNKDTYFVEWSYLKKMEVGMAKSRTYDIKRGRSLNNWKSSEKTVTRCKTEMPSVWLTQGDYNRKFGGHLQDKIEIFYNDRNLVEGSNPREQWVYLGEVDNEYSAYHLDMNWVLQIPIKEVKNNTITLTIIKHLPWHKWAKNEAGWIRPIGTYDRQFIEQIVIKLK